MRPWSPSILEHSTVTLKKGDICPGKLAAGHFLSRSARKGIGLRGTSEHLGDMIKRPDVPTTG